MREFRRVCGSQPEATAVLLDLAALLPTREQQLALQLASQGAATPAPRSGSRSAGGSVADVARGVAGYAADMTALQGGNDATAPASPSDAAGQAPIVATASGGDLEAAADSSVPATAGASSDPGAGNAGLSPGVDDMLDSSWTASHDSR